MAKDKEKDKGKEKPKGGKSGGGSSGWFLKIVTFLLFVIGIAMLAGSIFVPWAKARVVLGLTTKMIYAYKEQSLHIILLVPPFVIGGIIIAAIFGLSKARRLLAGFIIFLLAGGICALGVFLKDRIEKNDVSFLGITPLQLADVQPYVGVFFLIIGGGVLALVGLKYMITSGGGK
jgi:hypothetical protein